MNQPIIPSQPGRELITPPAIFLMVTAGLGVLLALPFLALHLFAVSLSAIPGVVAPDSVATRFAEGSVLLHSSLELLANGFVFFGAWKMMKMQAWRLALVASIVALVPWAGTCGLLGLPAGIWSLVTLNREEVKAAFRP